MKSIMPCYINYVTLIYKLFYREISYEITNNKNFYFNRQTQRVNLLLYKKIGEASDLLARHAL